MSGSIVDREKSSRKRYRFCKFRVEGEMHPMVVLRRQINGEELAMFESVS